MRALYGMRNGRLVHTEAVATADHEDQKRLARSRLHDFDSVEIWDGAVLCVRLRHEVDRADILNFSANRTPSQVDNTYKRLMSAA